MPVWALVLVVLFLALIAACCCVGCFMRYTYKDMYVTWHDHPHDEPAYRERHARHHTSREKVMATIPSFTTRFVHGLKGRSSVFEKARHSTWQRPQD